MNPITMRRQGGVALLEVMIAVILLGIGLLGAIGLQARSYSALADAGQRAEATIQADKLVAMINNDVANIGGYALAANATPGAALAPWVAETRALIPGAAAVVTVAQQGTRWRVDITITWRRKQGTDSNSHQVTAYVI
ncbi:prepilin-type N-terminal cleavage/methylation domain-containing protein [[Empedobacter] haloabium]|uniref:Prepilin-type N-terminal cleavage/methylation domain-containing protein n=1 Tax=[Empedobacter] haloabium TaxID=592317 RepID=A0ABZ1UEG4_9BURK